MLATDDLPRIHARRIARRAASMKPRSITCPRCGLIVLVRFRPGPAPTYCGETCRRRAAKARAAERRRAGIAAQPLRVRSAKIHGHAWRKLRRLVLDEHQTCQRPGCYRDSTDVDHVIRRRTLVEHGIADPDAPRWLRSLCRYCHAHASAAFDGGFGNPLRPAEKLAWLGLPPTLLEEIDQCP